MAEPKVIKKPFVRRRPRVEVKKSAVPTALIKPRVFQDCHRRTFLLLEEHGRYNRYLAARDEELQVVKLEHDLPARGSDGNLISQETTSTTDLHPVMVSKDAPYDLAIAAQKFFDSLLVRTHDATCALCAILGKPIPEITEAEQQARAAKIESLKLARAQRQSNLEETRNTNPQHNLNEEGDSTMSTKKTPSKKTTTKTNGKKSTPVALTARPGTKRATLIDLLKNGTTLEKAGKALGYNAASVKMAIYCLKRDLGATVKEEGEKFSLA